MRSTPAGSHVPVMLAECLEVLDPRPGQTIVDCTMGSAGHAVELLRRIGSHGHLHCFDLDGEHIASARVKLESISSNFTIHHGNFAGVAQVVTRADGVLADLGMSSMQVDDPARGFSFRRDGPLDMRMDRCRGRTAAELLETLSEEELADCLRDYGDEPMADAIAEAIVRSRGKLRTTFHLRALIENAAPVRVIKSPGAGPPRKQQLLPATRVFQALRILVNRELSNLEHLLRVLPALLAPRGRAAIISFHSGEDRLVKSAFRAYPKHSDEPIRPSEEEKQRNPRARSAKLRWAAVSED